LNWISCIAITELLWKSNLIMLFTLKEATRLIGCSAFEILIHVISFLVFSVLVTLKVDGGFPELSWSVCFIPLFAADALNAYFTLIIFIRFYAIQEVKQAGFRTLWSLLNITLIFVSKLLVCQNLEQVIDIKYGEALAPFFVILTLLVFKGCQTSNH